MKHAPRVQTALRLALGMFLAGAGVLKLIDPPSPPDYFSMIAAALAIPRLLIVVASSMLEIGLGAALVAGRDRERAALLAFALVVVFTASSLVVGEGYQACGCFGATLQIGWRTHLVVNCGLLAASWIAVLRFPAAAPAAPLPSRTE